MKLNLLFIFLFVSTLSLSQERNIGLGLGTDKGVNSIGIHSYFELRPTNAKFSLNFDPSYHHFQDFSIATFPFYFKLIFGKKFRVCPSVGLFNRTNSSGGWLTNLNLEYSVTERALLTTKASLTTDYYTIQRTSPGGAPTEYRDKFKWIWFNIGFKRNLN